MKGFFSFAVASVITGTFALPSPTENGPITARQAAACATPVTLSGNPFASRSIYANKFYSSEVVSAAAQMTDTALASAALKVADVGTFLWIDTRDKISVVEDGIKDVPCGEIAALVIYDLPGRDCAAKASNGELAVGEIDIYKTEYIDQPGAKELATVYKNAGSPKSVRGVATNVAGWNAWDLSPGEFSKATDAQWNKAQNEKKYIELFSPELKSAGMPGQAIVDTGRNGVTGLREEWGNWCNVNGAGFGVRPTSNTGSSLVDSFVWVKPGGESDGTSDSSATRYDSFCGKSDSFKPSPEAGQWNQAYFEMLVKNAKPAL
ncbi:cellobiohydrolase-like protein II precursor [Alternaria alternata]|nr:cellobiohydrolase-like protein II precursor [Alternaria alternata]